MNERQRTPIAVLALDDDVDDLAILEHYLGRTSGFDVELHAFTRVEEAHRALETHRFDLAFLDYMMGARRGLEVFQELQLLGLHAPAILVTDQGDEEVAVRAMHLGFSDYIPKENIGAESLGRAISNAIEKFRLRDAVARHQEELERTVVELRARNDEIQTFYHSLSHELKTPLTAAREFVSIVLDELQGPLTADQKDSLGTARNACDHMVRSIDDLLDASRLETGKFTLDRRMHGLREVVECAVRQCAPAAETHGVHLTLRDESGALKLLVDRARIVQVLSNLIGNAIKFTSTGGRVSVHVEPPRSGAVRVSVSDTGRGIAPRDLSRIFERLYQTSEGDAAIHAGMGIGLNLVRELVTLHGGDVDVQSELGVGSVFSFTLPVGKEHAPERSTNASHHEEDPHR